MGGGGSCGLWTLVCQGVGSHCGILFESPHVRTVNDLVPLSTLARVRGPRASLYDGGIQQLWRARASDSQLESRASDELVRQSNDTAI